MKIIDELIALFYPRKCPFCRKIIDEDKRVCKVCLSKLPFIIDHPPRKLSHIDECYSALSYEGMVRESLLRYKFNGAVAYAEIYGDFLTKCIDENKISCDIITWVPLSRQRLRKRGYDQAALLAQSVSEKTGLEYRAMLRKKHNNKAQSGVRNAEARKTNVKGVYELLTAENVCGRRVLLIDDIVTTGSTISECALMLKKAGAEKIVGLTVASKNN